MGTMNDEQAQTIKELQAPLEGQASYGETMAFTAPNSGIDLKVLQASKAAYLNERVGQAELVRQQQLAMQRQWMAMQNKGAVIWKNNLVWSDVPSWKDPREGTGQGEVPEVPPGASPQSQDWVTSAVQPYGQWVQVKDLFQGSRSETIAPIRQATSKLQKKRYLWDVACESVL